MNRQLNFIALGLMVFIATTVFAQAEEEKNNRFSVEFQRDPDGKLSPDTYFPQKWSDNWSSGLAYRSTTDFSSDTLAGITESKVGTLTDERRIRLDLLSYNSSGDGMKYTIGAAVQRTDINRNEFGYVHLVTTTPAIDQWEAIDNRVIIGVNAFALRGDISFGEEKDSAYLVRMGLNVSPASSLSVTQETDFRPAAPVTGTSSGSSAQKLNWEATLETRYRPTEWLTIGIDARYEVMPYRYQIAQLNSTLNGFSPVDIETTDITRRVGIKFIFKRKEKESRPFVGLANETVDSKDDIAGTSTQTSQVLLLVGLTGNY